MDHLGGEMLLNKGNGGAIALLTTTRPVFSQTNFRLNNQFYRNVFKKENGNYLRLGDIFKFTKNNTCLLDQIFSIHQPI